MNEDEFNSTSKEEYDYYMSLPNKETAEEKAASAFKKMLIDLGHKNPMVLYAYSTQNKKVITGGDYDSRFYALGAIEQIKFDLLNQENNEVS